VERATPCEMSLNAAGLPHRTELLLARERSSFPSMVGLLFSRDKGETETPPLTAEALSMALDSKEPGRPYTAAFLIGRCRAQDPAADRMLTQRLEEVVDRSEHDVVIEAAMSLALRGQADRARPILRAQLTSPDPLGNQYKAAFYLAQFGDPSGYPALVTTLHSDIPHYRLMALRHAVAFAPYDGQEVGGTRVDVRRLLVERLGDADELVRCEVPFYLEELGVRDLRSVLEPVENSDPSPMVRTAAHMVLERNPSA
jgi:HEAT repeat protein